MKHYLLLAFLIITSSGLNAANYYWVGGTGAWTDTQHWATSSGGSLLHTTPPGIEDDVFFDNNSFFSAADSIALPLAGALNCRHFSWSVVLVGPAITINGFQQNRLKVYGNFEVHSPDIFLSNDTAWPHSVELRNTTNGIRSIDVSIHQNELYVDVREGEYELRGSYLAVYGLGVSMNTVFRAVEKEIYARVLYVQNGGRAFFLRSELFLGCGAFFLNNDEQLEYSSYPDRGDFYYDLPLDDIDYLNGSTITILGRYNRFEFGEYNPDDLERNLDAKIITFNHTRLSLGRKTKLRSIVINDSGEVGFYVADSLYLAPGGVYRFLLSDLDEFKPAQVGYLNAQGSCERPILLEESIPEISSSSISNPNNYSIASSNDQELSGVIFNNFRVYHHPDSSWAAGQWTTTNSVDITGNTALENVPPPSPRRLYRLAGGNEWYDADYWSLSSNGPGGECPPLPTDDVVFDEFSFSVSSFSDTITTNLKLSFIPRLGRSLPFFCHDLEVNLSEDKTVVFDNSELRLFGGYNLDDGLDWQIDTLWLQGYDQHVLRSNGVKVKDISLDTQSGSYSLSDDLLSKPDAMFRHLLGSFHSNGYNLDFGFLFLNSRGTEQLTDTFNLRNSRVDLRGVIEWYGENHVLLMNGLGTSDQCVFQFEGTQFYNHLDGGRFFFLNQDFGCDVISLDEEVETIIIQDNFEISRNSLGLRKVDFKGDGQFFGTLSIDTVRFAPDTRQQLRINRWMDINDLLDARGNNCRPIELVALQASGTTIVKLDSTATSLADYLRIDRVIADPEGINFIGPNSLVTNWGNEADTTLNWQFAYQPTVDPFSLSPGFLGMDTTICIGDLPFSLQPVTELAPPILNYDYDWWDGGTAPSSEINEAGEYELALTFIDQLELLCSMSDTLQLDVIDTEPGPWFPVYELEDPSCYDARDGSVRVYLPDSISEYTLNGLQPDVTFGGFTNLAGGVYGLEVVGPTGCPAVDSLSLMPPPPISTTLPPVLTANALERVRLDAGISGGRPPYAYRWFAASESSTNDLSCLECPNPQFSAIRNGRYFIELVDANACTFDSTTLLTVAYNRDIYLPNAFSPNFDGINDHLTLFGPVGTFTVTDFQVFDRWGALVYSTPTLTINDPSGGWDGMINGKPATAGSYVVTYVVTWGDDVSRRQEGVVDLLR